MLEPTTIVLVTNVTSSVLIIMVAVATQLGGPEKHDPGLERTSEAQRADSRCAITCNLAENQRIRRCPHLLTTLGAFT